MTSIAPPPVTITATLPRDPRLLVRDHNRNMNDTLRDAAAFHHEQHIPRHFEPFARAKYRYARRTPGYLAIKRRLGRNTDLVFTGATKLAVTSTRQITATSKRSRLIMRLPFAGGTGKFRIFGNSLSSAQKNILRIRAEIEVIADDEQRTINRRIGQEYTRRANLPGTKYRVRTRGQKT